MAYYRKALELDPENETYKSNLKIAELKLREAPSPVSAGRGAGDMSAHLHQSAWPGRKWCSFLHCFLCDCVCVLGLYPKCTVAVLKPPDRLSSTWVQRTLQCYLRPASF